MRTQRERVRPLRTGPSAAPATAQTTPLAEAREPIDRTHLARYTLGSPLLEREIVGLFLAQLPLSLEQLRFAATDREWQIAAHTIKGSARSVGAWQVSELAVEAEKIAGIDDDEERTRILGALEDAVETVEIYAELAFGHAEPRA